MELLCSIIEPTESIGYTASLGAASEQEAFRDASRRAKAAGGRTAVGKRTWDDSWCAGLLQVTLRFAHDTGLPFFKEAATSLCEQLLSRYDPERTFGFSSIEPEGNLVDQPGLLDGAPGVVLTMLSAATDFLPSWDRLFLLS